MRAREVRSNDYHLNLASERFGKKKKLRGPPPPARNSRHVERLKEKGDERWESKGAFECVSTGNVMHDAPATGVRGGGSLKVKGAA